MTAALDLNDRAQRGELDTTDPIEGATPVNDAAKRQAEQMPRVVTVRRMIQKSYERATSREERVFCTALHWKIDFATGGMRPGHTWLLGADTNWGKSTYAVACCDENIQDGKRALIVSAEDDESLYGDRLLARRAQAWLGDTARFSAARMRAGRMNQTELEAVTEVLHKAEDKPLFLDARGKSIEVVCRQANELIRAEGIDLVEWDYLQEFRTEKPYKDERVKFRDIAAQMRGVIKGNNITGMILSQITVTEGKKYPDKHSIRESRDVSNAAEVVMLGYTPNEDIRDREDNVVVQAGQRCIKIDKAKDGRKAVVGVDWDDHCATFKRTRNPHDQATQDAQFDDMFDNYRG